MGSVSEMITCPNCQHEGDEPKCHDDYNYKTGEQHTFCTQCGSVWQVLLKRNPDGSLAKDKDDKPQYEEWNQINDRIAKIKFKDTVGYHMYGLNDETFNQFLSNFKKDVEEHGEDITEATISFKQDGKWITQDLKTYL